MTNRACVLLGMLYVPCLPAPMSTPEPQQQGPAPLLDLPCRLLLRQMGVLSLKKNVPSLCKFSRHSMKRSQLSHHHCTHTHVIQSQ